MRSHFVVSRNAIERLSHLLFGWASTELIESNKMTDDLGLPPINAAEDRVMLCGSPGMLVDLKHMLEGRGFKEGNTSTPGDFVVERAFAEK